MARNRKDKKPVIKAAVATKVATEVPDLEGLEVEVEDDEEEDVIEEEDDDTPVVAV